MAYSSEGKVMSFEAAGSLASGIVVYVSGKNQVNAAGTSTVAILGVTVQKAITSSVAVDVALDGIVKCVCGGTVTAGSPVKVTTGGTIVNATLLDTATTKAVPIVGIALEAGATSGVIVPVALKIDNPAS